MSGSLFFYFKEDAVLCYDDFTLELWDVWMGKPHQIQPKGGKLVEGLKHSLHTICSVEEKGEDFVFFMDQSSLQLTQTQTSVSMFI